MGLVLARLREERAASAAFVMVVFVTSFLFAVSPRLYDRAKETALRTEIAAASSSQRNIELSREMSLPAGPRDATSAVVTMGAREEERLPPSVRSLIVARTYVIETPRWLPVEPIIWTTVIPRIQEGLDGRLRYLHGRPPEAATPSAGGSVTSLEAALSVRAAEQLGITANDIRAGRSMEFTADPTDVLARRGERISLTFTGIFEPATSLDEDYWFDDRSLLVPRIRAVSADDSFSDVAVAVAPGSYAALARADVAGPPDLRYAWRYLIDPDRLSVDGLDRLAADLRSMEGRFRARDAQSGDATVSALRSRLLPLVDGQLTVWTAADAALVAAGTGPVGLAAGAIAFFALLSAQRRTRLLRAAKARGASTLQVVAATLLECLLLAVPVAAIAGALAVVVVPSSRLVPTVLAAGAVAAATTLLLIAAVVSRFGSTFGVRPDGAVARLARRRGFVLEALIVGLAAGGTVLVLQRGVRATTATGGLAATDLLLASVPALVALAAGILAGRAFPRAVGLIASIAERRSDFVPVLALRRASRESGASPVLIVLVASAMIATFSAAMLAHLERASEEVPWNEVGASHRVAVEAGSLPIGFDVADVGGVEATSTAYRTRGARTARSAVELLALDPAGHARVVAGTPADTGLLAGLAGADAGSLGAIVSTSLLATDGITVGEPFELRLAGRPIRVVAIQARASFPSTRADRPFVVTSLPALRAAHPDLALGLTDIFIRASDDASSRLAERVQGVAGARLESRAAAAAALRDDSVMVAVRAGIAASALVAGAYAILAVAAAIALRGSSRVVESAQLRTLGLTRGDALRLSIAEHGAPTLMGFVVGSAVGVVMFALVRGSVGLAPLLGSTLDIPPQLEALHLVVLLAALIGVAAAGIAVGAAAERRATPSTEIRRGLDP